MSEKNKPEDRRFSLMNSHAGKRSQDKALGSLPGSDASASASSGVKPLARERLRRYGFVGIIVPHEAGQGPAIQEILSEHAELIQGRMGLPHLENDTLAVITLIVHGNTDELGSLTGRLGRLPGITVKSGLAPLKDEE